MNRIQSGNMTIDDIKLLRFVSAIICCTDLIDNGGVIKFLSSAKNKNPLKTKDIKDLFNFIFKNVQGLIALSR